jgi:hypothetical protein
MVLISKFKEIKMTNYPVDNTESLSGVSDNTPTVGTSGRATSPNMGLEVSAPGSATTPNSSQTVSAPVRASSSTPMTPGV